ncbi:MAG: hypothetical protein WD025_03515 [Bacteriovoracaceae bacterium]
MAFDLEKFDFKQIKKHSSSQAEIYFCRFNLAKLPLARIKEGLKQRNLGDHRAAEIYVSRSMISWLLSKEGLDQPWNQVSLRGHCQIDGLSGHLSLAHTRSICLVARSPAPVGVDIELKNRKINLASQDKFIGPGDSFAFNDLLKKWCFKEAAFKALATQSPKAPKTLKEVEVKGERFYYNEASGSLDFLKLEGHIVALAKLT